MRIALHGPAISVPRFLERAVVTLNIEAQSARVLVARGGRAVAWNETFLEEGLVREGVIVDPEGVGGILKSLLKPDRVRGTRLMASVTGLRSIPRLLEMPHMSVQMMEAAVSREAKREMPVPLQDIYLSWQALGDGNGKQRVFALGVPRDTLDPLLRALAIAGSRPYAVDIKPLALARAVNRREAIVANVEPETADIIVVADGMPAIMRTVASRSGTSTGDESIERFHGELVRTVKFYSDTHRQEPLSPDTPLFITGSLAPEAAETVSLDGQLPFPVEPLVPLLECPPELPVHSYAVNIGLALKEV
jgi:type IV pilus assembly protein PilM